MHLTNGLIFVCQSFVLECLGVTHNLPLLRAIMSEPCFVAGKISTNYLTKVFPDGFTGEMSLQWHIVIVLLVLLLSILSIAVIIVAEIFSIYVYVSFFGHGDLLFA